MLLNSKNLNSGQVCSQSYASPARLTTKRLAGTAATTLSQPTARPPTRPAPVSRGPSALSISRPAKSTPKCWTTSPYQSAANCLTPSSVPAINLRRKVRARLLFPRPSSKPGDSKTFYLTPRPLSSCRVKFRKNKRSLSPRSTNLFFRTSSRSTSTQASRPRPPTCTNSGPKCARTS